jgi:cytochrome P450
MNDYLPPGPRMPAVLQTLGTWSRPTAFLERARARYGPRFTVRLLGQPPIVMISDPEEIKQIFQAPPEILHPGEGARILEPLVGSKSVILLDEGPHLEQRKLLLPAFHGERMQRLSDLMGELAEREVEQWPLGERVALHPRLQRLTLEIILRAVFGLERGAKLDSLRDLLTKVLAFSESPLSLLRPLPNWLASLTPLADFEHTVAQADELIFAVVEDRRAEAVDTGEGGEDVLSMLLAARHEDGSPMTPEELRDELVTALVAGHETTASQLAWTLERISREPRVLARLYEEVDGDAGEDYLTATINESLRHRPVLMNAEPRLVKEPIEIGGITYPRGVALFASGYLMHHDPDIYPDPNAFRPERFVEEPPGTYTWIPFGGGRRRCLGASFAQLEMKIVLRTVLERYTLTPANSAPERARRRSITISPAGGGQVILSARSGRAADAVAGAAEAPALA